MQTQQHNILTEKHRKLLDDILLYGPFGIAALMFVGCLVIELVPIELSLELRSTIYDVVGVSTFAISIPMNICYGRNFGIGRKLSTVYSIINFVVLFTGFSLFCRMIETAIFGVGSLAAFRTILLLPILCIALSRFDERDAFVLCDCLTPCYFFQHGIATHGCWITGCCGGRTMSWGLINPRTELYVFPTQPCVIVFALGISLWGILYANQKNYRTGGEIYALSLIGYGAFRYIIEFFTDNLRVIGALSLYSIYSLIMVVLGMLVYFWKPKQPVEINACETTEKTMEEEI